MKGGEGFVVGIKGLWLKRCEVDVQMGKKKVRRGRDLRSGEGRWANRGGRRRKEDYSCLMDRRKEKREHEGGLPMNRVSNERKGGGEDPLYSFLGRSKAENRKWVAGKDPLAKGAVGTFRHSEGRGVCKGLIPLGGGGDLGAVRLSGRSPAKKVEGGKGEKRGGSLVFGGERGTAKLRHATAGRHENSGRRDGK